MSAYSDANCTVRREHCGSIEAGGAATTEYNKFRSFQKTKLKAVHAAVTVAGTNAGHGLDVFHGTTSVARITLGTAAAGVVASTGKLDRVVGSMEQLSVKTLVDAAGKAQVVFEYEVMPDAVQTL